MSRPNFLVIMSDDHTHRAAPPCGTRALRTPALQRLATDGLAMRNAFTPTPVCSPARASFFTGRLPSQHGIHDWLFYNVNLHSEWQRAALAQQPSLTGQQTLPQQLADAGYSCGLSGKWHCGGDDEPQPGFAFWDALRKNTGPRDGPYSVAGRLIERQGWHSEIVTDGALRFLRERERGRPFFLFVGYIGAHSPWRGHPERLVEPYRGADFTDIPQEDAWPFGQPAGEATLNVSDRRETLAQYYAAVSHIDENVGRLLDELESQALRADTLVIFTADHGLNCGQHGLWGKGNATRPLNMLEESIRVPLLLSWPGRLPAGETREQFVDHCDLHATLLQLAGLQDSAPAGPGRSFAPLLTDAQALPDWRRAQAGEYGPTRMWRTAGYKLVRQAPGGPERLFDLQADPRETRDIRRREPQRAAALGAQLDAFFARHECPARSGLRAAQGPRHNFHEAWRAPLRPGRRPGAPPRDSG